MIHQSVHRGHYHAALILKKMPEHLHPLARQKISMYIGIVEQKISCWVKPCIFFKIAEIIVDLPCSGIIVGDYESPCLIP